MKLIVNYKGINKTMLNVETYQDVVKFVHENFFLRMSKWSMSYIDSDGDLISLDSDMDLKTMFETCDQQSMKIYVKDVEKVEEDIKQVGRQFNINQINETQKIQTKPLEIEEEVVQEPKVQEKVEAKQQEVKANEESLTENEKNKFQRCGGRQMWKKKIEEKMAKFVDERIQSLLPYITKMVEEKMQNKGQKPVQSQQKKDLINHKVKCNLCGEKEIHGIRYKCTKCPLFNLCENCQRVEVHNHNMIKMKFLEQEQGEKTEMNSWKPWWKKGENSGIPVPPFGGMPGMPGMMPGMPGMMPGMPGVMYPAHRFPPPPHSGQFGHPPPPFMPFNPGKVQKSLQKSCDERLKITKKCFKLVEMFGGQPKLYEEFVKKNIDLKFDELSKLYKVMNENVKIQSEAKQKVKQKCQKLSFYFNEPKQNFVKIVQANPASNLKELLKLICNNKPKVEEKQEQKVKQAQEKEASIVPPPKMPVMFSPPLMVPPPFRKPMDIQKRNECILDMKELFGPENVFDYINFYSDNNELENAQIIEKYLDKLSKK